MLKPKAFIPIIFFYVMLLVGCASPGNRLLAEGQNAYHMQEYHTAFVKLLAAAKTGNACAEYAVGYLYYYGIGTPPNPYEAIKWFRKAASYHGLPEAKEALHLIERSGPPEFRFGNNKDYSAGYNP